MILPTMLNGYLVIRAEAHNSCATVMVDRNNGAKMNNADYVVATWWPELGNKWSWGHYSDNMADAMHDFHEAEARNAKRWSSQQL